MYSFKKRVIAFCGVMFFLMVSVGISYLGIFKFREYLSYPDVVNFSSWVTFSAAFFFFFTVIGDDFSCYFYREEDNHCIRLKITENHVYHLRVNCPKNVYLCRKIHNIFNA